MNQIRKNYPVKSQPDLIISPRNQEIFFGMPGKNLGVLRL